jgi:hypothetical protein
VPDRIRGRIFAFDGALITATFAVSSVATGFLAVRFGARPVATGLGLIGLAYAGVWTWLTTDVRRATRIEGCIGPEAGEVRRLAPDRSPGLHPDAN